MESAPVILQSAAESIFTFGIMFIITLAVVITIHELGHYFAARLCGVRIEQFSFGFGRELFGYTAKKSKTRWSFNVFPIGGYVKLFGDVDINNPIIWDHKNNAPRILSTKELEHAFCTKTVWQRFIIIIAGPAANIFLTLLICIAMFTLYGERSKSPIINALAIDSEAYEAGIQLGDIILSMDDKPLRRLDDLYDITWSEIPPKLHRYKILRGTDERIEKAFTARHVTYKTQKGVPLSHGQTGMSYMKKIKLSEFSAIEDVDVTNNPDLARVTLIKNMDKEIHVSLRYKKDKDDAFIILFPSRYNTHFIDPAHKDYDKIYLDDPDHALFTQMSLRESIQRSFFLIKKMSVDSYQLLKVAFTGESDDAVLGGIGKISTQNSDAVKSGAYDYIMFIAGFSMMIAFINILPIPALDGGYIVFLFYEIIRGKPISQRTQDLILIIGLVFIGGIMIFANVSDLISLLSPVKSN